MSKLTQKECDDLKHDLKTAVGIIHFVSKRLYDKGSEHWGEVSNLNKMSNELKTFISSLESRCD